MTPKEKAKELVDKMYYSRKYKDGEDYIPQEAWVHAKQCALIAVDEVIKSKDLNYLFTKEQIYSMEGTSDDRWIYEKFMKYWKQVKQEIEKL